MSDDRSESSNGTVDSLSGSTLVISGSAGSGSFKQSFAVDATTRVIAMGASTAAAATGGKVAIADIVGIGDQVTVSYRKAGSGLHADEVRVGSRPEEVGVTPRRGEGVRDGCPLPRNATRASGSATAASPKGGTASDFLTMNQQVESVKNPLLP